MTDPEKIEALEAENAELRQLLTDAWDHYLSGVKDTTKATQVQVAVQRKVSSFRCNPLQRTGGE